MALPLTTANEKRCISHVHSCTLPLTTANEKRFISHVHSCTLPLTTANEKRCISHVHSCTLPLTTANEKRSISHVHSRTSPLADTMRLPGLRRKTCFDSPNTPDVSTAIIRKSNLSAREYLLNYWIFIGILLSIFAVFWILLHWQLLCPESRSGSCWMD